MMFGTCVHNHTGPIAIMSLMLGSALRSNFGTNDISESEFINGAAILTILTGAVSASDTQLHASLIA